MKELRGTATAVSSVPVGECVQFLRAVGAYPAWCPEVVREVDVLERDGAGDPVRVRALLHMARGPLVRDFDVVLAIAAEREDEVRLTRVAQDASDSERLEMIWRVERGVSGRPGEPQQTRISLELKASLSVPRLLPLAGIGDGVAESFCVAASPALGSPRP